MRMPACVAEAVNNAEFASKTSKHKLAIPRNVSNLPNKEMP